MNIYIVIIERERGRENKQDKIIIKINMDKLIIMAKYRFFNLLLRTTQILAFSRVKVNDRQAIGEGDGSRAVKPHKFLRIRDWLQTRRRVETTSAVKLLDGYLPRGRTCPRQFQTYFNIHISSAPSLVCESPWTVIYASLSLRNPRSDPCTTLFLDVRTCKHKGGLGFT